MNEIWETLYLLKVVLLRHVVNWWRKEGEQPMQELVLSGTTCK